MQRPLCVTALLATSALLVCAHGAFANSIWVTSVARQCATASDDTVRVDVMLENNFDPIDGGTLHVSVWDSTVYPLVAVERGGLVAGWSQFNGYQQPLGGSVVINMSNDTPIPPGTSGQLVRLKFLTNCCTDGWYSSPFPAKIDVSGAGDFGPPMAWVVGTFLCAQTNNGMLYVENGITTCDGPSGTARVRVMVQNTTVPIDAAGLDVVVWQNPSMTYVTYERGDLTADWDTFDVTTSPNGGRVYVDGSHSEPIPAGTTGTLVTLVFQANCCSVGPLGYGQGHITLEPQDLRGDLTSFMMEAGRWYCSPVATRPSSWGHVKSLYR